MTPKLHEDFLRIPLAHRALHDVQDGRPENSRAAIRAAVTAGYGIEVDIQCSADDHAMVFHDYDLARLAHAKGIVRDRSRTDLEKLKLRGGNEGIPSLPEVLEIVDGRVPLLIEVKDQDGEMGPNVGILEARVSEALSGYSGPVAVMSFNPFSVQEMARQSPAVARGLVTCSYDATSWDLPEATCARLREIPDYQSAGCSFISHNRADLARPRVADLKAAGAHVLCWTVKSPQEEAQARKVAENITFEQYLAPFPA